MFIKEHRKEVSNLINNSLSVTVIDELARETGFVKRAGKLSASCFVDTLVFTDTDQGHTSLVDMTADLRQTHDIDISKVALHNKMTATAVEFLKKLIGKLIAPKLDTGLDKTLSLHFPKIKIKDSTRFALPESFKDAYKGFENFSKKNGLMSLQYEYDLVNSEWLSIRIAPGLRNDQQDSKETIDAITKGDLHIRDLEYITATYLPAIVDKEAFFLNRLPPMAGVYDNEMKPLDWKKIDRKLKWGSIGTMEMKVLVYEKEKIACRLIIERVSEDEYKRRLKKAEEIAKSKKVGISDVHKIKLQFNLFITNVEEEILPVSEIRKTYYLRWQIELVFKTWKSFFRINNLKKVNKDRLECQILAKLIWILINWKLFQTCNQHVRKLDSAKGVSIIIFFKRCIKLSSTLRQMLLGRISIKGWLKYIYLPMIGDCLCEAPKGKQTHYQSLEINKKAKQKA